MKYWGTLQVETLIKKEEGDGEWQEHTVGRNLLFRAIGRRRGSKHRGAGQEVPRASTLIQYGETDGIQF